MTDRKDIEWYPEELFAARFAADSLEVSSDADDFDPDSLTEPCMSYTRDDRVAALRAENERLREALEREEKAQCAIIQERDNAEEALSRMYQSVMGEPPEWSSGFGHAAAIADTEEYVEALRRRSLAKPDGLKADMYWDAEDTENCANDADTVMEPYGSFEPVQMETGFRGPNIWGFHDGASSFVFATQAECHAAIDAAMGREGRDDG